MNSQSPLVPEVCPDGFCPVIGDTPLELITKEAFAGNILAVAQLFTYIIGALAVLYIVIAAIQIMTDLGDGKRAEMGRKNFVSSIVGLVLAIVAYSIVSVIGQLASSDILSQLLNSSGN